MASDAGQFVTTIQIGFLCGVLVVVALSAFCVGWLGHKMAAVI